LSHFTGAQLELTTLASGMIVVAAINLRPGCQARAMKSRDYATPRSIMTATDVAEYLKVNRETIYLLAGKGQIPFFRMGIHLRFHSDAIEKWMTDGTNEVLKKTGYWKNMTPAQGKAELKRRAKVRAANKLEKSKSETTP
jgi:excisionase family DNA binding protein